MIQSVRLFNETPPPQPSPPTPEPPAPPAPADAEFSYNSQDPFMMPNRTTVVKAVEAGPSVAKARLNGGLEPVDGRFVYPDGDPRATAAVSFAAVANTIHELETALGQSIQWPFSQAKLGVHPDDGEDLNAYYSRYEGSVHFFHSTDPITGAAILSGASGEVASHEAGHALLDALRPGYLESWATDVGAFHESFGDVLAMLMALKDERVIQRVAVQTGGDLRRPNVAAHLGESLGVGINDTVGSNVTGGDYTRTAINSFKWQNPDDLPYRGGPDQLGSEVHDFSRLWTGAFYDVLCAINNENIASGMSPQDALRAAGAECLTLTANLLKNAPQGEFTYRDMAEAFVQSDVEHNGGKRAELIRGVFTIREILRSATEPPPAPEPPPGEPPHDGLSSSVGNVFTMTDEGRKPLSDVTRSVRVKLSGDDYGLFNGAVVETVVDKDGSLSKDAELAIRTRKQLKRLIDQGRIRYNDPAYKMKAEDYFDPQGRPYVGVVRWDNGQMVIERVKIAN